MIIVSQNGTAARRDGRAPRNRRHVIRAGVARLRTGSPERRDGYGHVCKMKTFDEARAAQQIAGQMAFGDYEEEVAE